jgi:hypothetical protein
MIVVISQKVTSSFPGGRPIVLRRTTAIPGTHQSVEPDYGFPEFKTTADTCPTADSETMRLVLENFARKQAPTP